MVDIHNSVVERAAAFARADVAEVVRFADGVTNDTYKVSFRAHHAPVVLRLYRDTSKVQVEVAALRKVRTRVPSPTLLHVEPVPVGEVPPFIILEYVDGISFRQFRRRADRVAVSDVAHQIGRVLAAIHAIPLDVSFRHEKQCRSSEEGITESPLLHERAGLQLLSRVRAVVASRRREVDDVMRLQAFTHGDFNNRNILVKAETRGWKVAAVVDWESAGYGGALRDIARFLQYETRSRPSREPNFTQGYLDAGGYLPAEWWSLSRVINLIAQCQLLSEEQVPDEIIEEVVELMRTTLAEV